MAEKAKPTLRLRLSAAAESIVRRGHPWVFSESIRAQNRDGTTGELAVIFDRADKFLAAGLFDPLSPIRVRLLVTGKPELIDERWWRQRIDAAVHRRDALFDSQTDGYRVINGESDGFPGLVLDRYGATHVIKIYTTAWLPHLPMLEALWPKADRRVLRLSRNIQNAAENDFRLRDGQILSGPRIENAVTFLENGLRFEADVQRGQKTGFFLDQRDNRQTVRELAKGRTVLNLFSFTGGFSVYAAAGGALNVSSLDQSEHALAGAVRNFRLNEIACPHEVIKADAFTWLQRDEKRKYGLIVIDPPSLAKRETERADALKAYEKLIAAGIARLEDGGILVACSCSAHVSAEEFFGVARHCAKKSGRKFTEIKTSRHAADHPAAFPEADYLKAIFLEF